MKRIIFPAVTVLLISFSCTKTLEDPAEDAIKDKPAPVVTEFGVMLPTTVDNEAEEQELDAHTGATVRSGLDEGTRTALADKIGSSWPNYWAAGDAICVNGILSEALAADSPYVGTDRASFRVSGTLSTPYHYVYPGSALSDYVDGSANLNLPLTQTWSASTYDPSAFVMVGKGTSTNLSLLSMMSAIRLTVPGNYACGKWASVRFESLGSEKVSGLFTTDFSSLSATKEGSSGVSLYAPQGGVNWGSSVFILIPAQTYEKGMNFTICATDGTRMNYHTQSRFSAMAGRVYPLTTSDYTPAAEETEAITLTALSHSPSTLSFTWTEGGTIAEDIAQPYWVELYRDAACTDKVVTYKIDGSHSCWANKRPAFVFSGLLPGTTYWCEVHDTLSHKVSPAVSATTDTFRCVDAATVSDAGVGDIILAEDFSEITWSTDEIGGAAGFQPGIRRLDPLSGVYTAKDGTFRESSTSSMVRLYGITTVASDKRLYNWGFYGNSTVYSFAGYVRVGTTSTRTVMVSPALSGIPEGMLASIDVTVTSCKLEDNQNDVAVFLQDRRQLTLKLAPDQTGSSSFSGSGGKYEGNASLTNGYPLEAVTKSWTTKTVRIENVTANDCLLIGSLENISGKNRFCLNDVQVRIVSLHSPEGSALHVESVDATSSTLSFTWTEGVSEAEDASKAYVAALYSDAACSQLVVSHTFAAGNACWKGGQPTFVFGGLTPSTTYYFKVVDTTTLIESGVIGVATTDFTVVEPSSVHNAGPGTVILAEDFSEVGYGPDEYAVAAGFVPSPRVLGPPSGPCTTSNGKYLEYNGTDCRMFGVANVASDKRLYNWGFFGNSAVYGYAGYLRVGSTSSGARTHVVTPALSGIPSGKYATVDVTVTSCKMDNSNNDVAIFVQKYSALTRVLAPDQTSSSSFSGSGGKFKGATLTNGTGLNAISREWTTKIIRIDGVTSGDCLLIGSLENIDTKNRFCVNDIKVEVVSLSDSAPVRATFHEASSSTLSFSWTCGGTAAEDAAKPYTVRLYTDEACTQAVAEYSIPANAECWRGTTPKFVFAGLAPSTTYWFRVSDTSGSTPNVSLPRSATTLAFQNVTMPSSVNVTGVVLAEDFSELSWGADYLFEAAGMGPVSSPTSFSDRTAGGFYKWDDYSASAFPELFGRWNLNSHSWTQAPVSATALNNSRLNHWACDSYVRIRPGYVALSCDNTSNHKGWILTPQFPVTKDMSATVKVTLTGANFTGKSGWDTEFAVVVLDEAKAGVYTDETVYDSAAGRIASFSWPDEGDATLYQTVSFTSASAWKTVTVNGLKVRPGDRIAIGPKKGSSGYTAMQLSDVTVEVLSLNDDFNPDLDDDITVYGRVRCNGVGVKGVVVSDGFKESVTDNDGLYAIASAKRAGSVFISVPSGYKVPVNGIIPQFFKRTVNAASVRERLDFDLTAEDQSHYTMLLMGDMHMARRTGDIKQFKKFTDEVAAYRSAHSSDKIYALTLGDMAWDQFWYTNEFDLSNYVECMAPLNGLPVFHTVGNHDSDANAVGDWDTMWPFRNILCPTWYSFNIGGVHYMVVDNIECRNTTPTTTAKSKYGVKVVDDVLNWIRRDLAYVSKSTPVVVAMHSPLWKESGEDYYGMFENGDEFVACFSGYSNVRMLTGHTHRHYTVDKGNIIETNSGSVCAAWWWSGYYYPTLNVAQDGSLSGYRVISVNNGAMTSYYKAVGRDASHQFRTYDRNCIQLTAANCGIPDAKADEFTSYLTSYGSYGSAKSDNQILINVWDYNNNWKVQVSENNSTWTTLSRSKMYDPLYQLTYTVRRFKANSTPSFEPSICRHIFSYTASSATKTIYIKVTDDEGRVYTETMTRPKAFTIENYQ